MAIPPFTPGFPTAGQSLGITRDPIRNNLDGTFQTVAINHYDNNNANAGKHRFVEMPILGATPTTTALEGALYTRTVTTGSELFYVKDNTPASAVQLSGPKLVAASGYTTLPGGVLMQWMSIVNPQSNTPYAYPIPFTTNLYNVQVIPVRSGAADRFMYIEPPVGDVLTAVRVNTNSNSWISMYVLAIGV